ncbi:MAG TPA: 3',5'-cyclic-nucleotide phosphodiesterase, partial [Anaeromyxobacteraceae bacterium]|nr:3',5'-cyclic-nucleotide phosphodiesterase [Anaeromyxobacteraceae bacterium]
MRIRVLGASGGELRGHGSTCFLVDGRMALDAGALTSRLDLEALDRVDHVLVTHAHLDHVKDVPLLADLLVGRRRHAVTVHASKGAASTLRRSLLNGRLWPDFTRIPSARQPVLRLRTFAHGRPFRVGPYRVTGVKVSHTVESTGFVVRHGGAAFAISGDTGPTAGFWREVNGSPDLGALLVEVSFPDRLQRLADRSGHLTPRTLRAELAKVERGDLPVYLYHLKPAFAAELKAEVAGLGLPGVKVLEEGDEIA